MSFVASEAGLLMGVLLEAACALGNADAPCTVTLQHLSAEYMERPHCRPLLSAHNLYVN